MNYPTEAKILEALRTVKTVCQIHEQLASQCDSCPFNVCGCAFVGAEEAPREWKLAPLPGDWRAFEQ